MIGWYSKEQAKLRGIWEVSSIKGGTMLVTTISNSVEEKPGYPDIKFVGKVLYNDPDRPIRQITKGSLQLQELKVYYDLP